MVHDESFVRVLAGIRAGDEDAAAKVFQRFQRRLIALAHVQLDPWIRRKVDPEDVVQAVFKSFFLAGRGGRFEVHTWNDLWKLLAEITLRKCASRMEYFAAQCRDASREVSARPRDDGRDVLHAVPAADPSPDEAVIFGDTLEQLTAGLDAEDRAIIELFLAGHTTLEISEQVGCSERSVRRVREQARKRLLRMQANSVQES